MQNEHNTEENTIAQSDSIPATPANTAESEQASIPAWAVAIRMLLMVAMLIGAIMLGRWWINNRKAPERKKHGSAATIVDLQKMHSGTYSVRVAAMGEVVPASEVEVTALVGGKIVATAGKDFAPGALFKANQTLLEIDPVDYEILVTQSKATLEQNRAALVKVQAELDQELGHQEVARKEYELMGEKLSEKDAALVLRTPYLKIAQSNVANARAVLAASESKLAQAELNLARTQVTAPFNCIILEKYVDKGSQASTSTKLANLVCTDEFWVMLSIPVDQLKWLNIPTTANEESGSRIIFSSSNGNPEATREGTLSRLTAELDAKGRTAQVLATVKDPLLISQSSPETFKLLLGSYMQGEIIGKTVSNVFKLPRQAVQEGGLVMICTPENRLEIRTPKSLWSDSEYFYFTEGFSEGEQVVVSAIAAPIDGMLLQDSTSVVPVKAPDLTNGVKKPNGNKKTGGSK